ncbi:hypothetical protein AQUCO_00900899v1 [Aquilegia coerulea]|uniref:Uncharacterized protein n=1 Tax=Aquilegia coerulea TaxID=218851 RepID=A0A2G5EFX9_AQUCA|nr:hypothetical protein AQUCO_00900899v1 [Aquilegia coerulea]
MSQITETTHDPLKLWKNFSSLQDKNVDLISFFMKGALSLSLLASIIFFLYSAYSNQTPWLICPICDNNNNNGSEARIVHHHTSVDNPEKTNISHIVFGIGGSVISWQDRRHYSELWWKKNITRGFVWLDEKPDTWPATSPPYQVSEDTSSFKFTNTYGSRSAIRIARIVLESFKLGFDNVRWFVLGDDDTVFFVENLVEVLSRYDHNQMYYIGGNSESIEQDVIHSYDMAYGGGGIAISYPLVEQLVKLLDGCINRYADLYGSDERIGACMAEIGVPLTHELGFHQVDIRGDPYGLLAAHPVAPLISLHHLDSLKPILPAGNSLDSLRKLVGAYKMDPRRTLQQSFCYALDSKWSISVSWGYTVQIYPVLLTAKELRTPLQTFSTWRTWSDWPFSFNTRPMSAEPCERPVIFYLDHVDEVRPGKTRSFYKRYLGETGGDCELATYAPVLALQTVNVSSSKMDQEDWNLEGQRQCSEVVSQVDGVLQIGLRRCRSGETLTPP